MSALTDDDLFDAMQRLEDGIPEDVAAQCGIRYIGAVDPGTTNFAVCIIDAKEHSRIVYWRVFCLDELCTDFNKENGPVCQLKVAKHFDSQMHALAWWLQKETCPLRRADVVFVERQEFTREMASVESVLQTNLCLHTPGVVLPATIAKQSKTLWVPKVYLGSSNAVKSHFGNWFTMVGGKNRTKRAKKGFGASSSSSSAMHGVGNVNRSETQGYQYSINKKNAKERGAAILVGKEQRRAFKADAEAFGCMNEYQVGETLHRMGTAKCDDLYDTFFFCMYVADVLIPGWWMESDLTKKARGYTVPYEAYTLPRNTNDVVIKRNFSSLERYLIHVAKKSKEECDQIIKTL